MQLLQKCYKKRITKSILLISSQHFPREFWKGYCPFLAGVLHGQEQISNLLLMAQITSKKKHSKLNAAKIYDQQYLLSQTSSLISQYQNTLKKLNIAQWPCTKRHPLFPDPFSSFLGSKIDKKERKETPNVAPYNYQYVIVRVSFSSTKWLSVAC